MHAARIEMAFADVREPVIEMTGRWGLLEQLGENRVFHTLDAAVQALAGTAARSSLRAPGDVEVH